MSRLCLIPCIPLLLLALAGCDSGPPDPEAGERVVAEAMAMLREARLERHYAHAKVNVRAGRGTSHEVVGSIARGMPVEVDSLRDGWYACYRAGRKWGYAYAELLHAEPLPDLEIVSWRWVKDKGFGVDGAVVWTVEVRNNTDQYLKHVKAYLTTYDSNDNIIDSDWTYLPPLAPGALRSTKSYADYYGTEKTARIRVTDD